ncbi:hypothetical protein D9M68_491850 [compost metagenome]
MRQAGHEFRIGEAARIRDHHAKVLAQAFEHQQRIGLRYVAHLAEVAWQGQDAQAIGRMRHGRPQQRGIQAAQVARRLGEVEIAADVQVQLAIAHGPAEVHQRHAAGQGKQGARFGRGGLRRLAAQCRGARGMRMFLAVLHHAGQVHGQGAGADARPRAQQQDAAPRAVAARVSWLRVQQPRHDFLDLLRRHRGIHEVTDARAQGRDRTFRLAQQPHRHPRQARRNARQQAGQLGRSEQFPGLALAQGEVQEHHLGRDVRQAPRQFFRAGRFLGKHPHVAQRLPQLGRDVRAPGAEQKPPAVLQAYPLACMCLHLVHRAFTAKSRASAGRPTGRSGSSPRR